LIFGNFLIWGCDLLNHYQQQFGLFASSPRHKAFSQNLQLWAFRFYPAARQQNFFFNLFYAPDKQLRKIIY
jgi:hypothetical protein